VLEIISFFIYMAIFFVGKSFGVTVIEIYCGRYHGSMICYGHYCRTTVCYGVLWYVRPMSLEPRFVKAVTAVVPHVMGITGELQYLTVHLHTLLLLLRYYVWHHEN
jgi:hypothetical protein